MKRALPELSGVELDDLLLKILTEAATSRSASALHAALPSALRPPAPRVAERLRELAQAGRLHVWPGGRSTLYATRPYDELLRERVLALLEGGATKTAAELVTALPSAAAARVRPLLRELEREGRIVKHPRLGRRTPYALHAPDALDYLRGPLEKLIKEQVTRGFSDADVRAALARYAGVPAAPASAPSPASGAQPSDGERLLAALVELNPQVREGALVFVPHLRQALLTALPERERFERAALGLLARGVIQLQAHPVPSQLTPEERETMIPDGRGSFYMAIGLRR